MSRKSGLGRAVARALVSLSLRGVAAAACAVALAGCAHNGQPGMASLQPRGATVAFESIDGPPPGQFQTLVRSLNDEAQSRRLAVLSREASSAYRVRGYLAAEVADGGTRISWVWDVFDRDEHRALRIDGVETAKQPVHNTSKKYDKKFDKKSRKETADSPADAWSVADDAMLRRIAHASMDQLAAFLTSPDIAPGDAAQSSVVGVNDSSPEAAGIFRIFQADADPVSAATAVAPAGAGFADAVPLPPPRPDAAAAVSARGDASQVQASL